MKTKLLVTYLNRTAKFSQGIELVDIFKRSASASPLPSHSGYLFEGVDPRRHPAISEFKITKNNRDIALNTLVKTLRQAFIKDLYEEVTIYITGLLAAAAEKGLEPGRLLGEHFVKLNVIDVLRCDDHQSVLDLFAKSLFRVMEDERSTKKLLKDMNHKLGLGVAQSFIDEALPYLDLRHVLVHDDGVADKEFCKKYEDFNILHSPATEKLSPGEDIKITHQVVEGARDKVGSLVQEYDKCAIDKDLIPTRVLAYNTPETT